MPDNYNTSICQINLLSEVQQQEIVDIYLSYYDAADAQTVLSDLLKKTKVLLLYHKKNLVGFTTLEVYEKIWNKEKIIVVYSGDTVVRKEHWGQQSLAKGWINAIAELKKESPGIPIYWFLIVKGHRTFKFLPAFAHTFYPHWEKECSDLKPLLDSLAQEKFGKNYDKKRGIISFEKSKGHLKEPYAYPKKNELSNKAVHFFLEKNPGYIQGDELACLCSFDDANLRPFTKRILYGGEKRS